MNIIIANDSFKGSLSSLEAATIIKQAILTKQPHAHIDIIPMADGGEGTVDALVHSTGGKHLNLASTHPLGGPCYAKAGVIHDEFFVIEAASVAGIAQLTPEERNPYKTTTRGLGELIKQGLDLGYRKFIVGLGGTCTNDAGLGMLTALGAEFLNQKGDKLQGFGEDLLHVCSVSFEQLDDRLKQCSFHVANDVKNPLFGDTGAAKVYAKQKGATPSQIEALDEAAKRLVSLIEPAANKSSLCFKEGAGAAGGLGYAFLLLGASLVSGAQLIAEKSELQDKIKQADWVITGEGKSDAQTLYGKLPYYVAKLAKEEGKRCLLVSGIIEQEHIKLLDQHFTAVFSTITEPLPIGQLLAHAEENLYQCMCQIAALMH